MTELQAYWPDAPYLEDYDVEGLLTSARVQCEEYAPALDEAAVVPENWRLAQAMQARALYRSALAGDNNQIGAEGFTVTVFPMDWVVRNLLRPKKGRLSVR
ncbi:hypothetical protein [Georgenia sp. H159]|uniref:hypothetical protein n=1 Tax=Georgenia sp. H159 TaxID=3076115 RepID=UPI002D798C49|nr:hypothetical protein [Georgenia sp. H159]